MSKGYEPGSGAKTCSSVAAFERKFTRDAD